MPSSYSRAKKRKCICSSCNLKLTDETTFQYVDESNHAITNNALEYCEDCYKIFYKKDYEYRKMHKDNWWEMINYMVKEMNENNTNKKQSRARESNRNT